MYAARATIIHCHPHKMKITELEITLPGDFEKTCKLFRRLPTFICTQHEMQIYSHITTNHRTLKNIKRKSLKLSKFQGFSTGRSIGIRTRGLLDPNQARYQTSPYPEIQYIITAFSSYVNQKYWTFYRNFSGDIRNFTDYPCLLPFAFQIRVIQNTAKDQNTTQKLQRYRCFSKQKRCQDRRNHRFAELGGRHKGRGEILQAPAENTVSQNRREYRQ